ncbi:DUF5134 domain-containing protein [Pseudonocardia sp. KRD291]|uniref:DUF5134 domain-containing protein n=1 Tax=Pseudonocardia sp. KRD291 TaxID=2792007 RepID=UPI001C4A0BEC|nr:DUF5134 domain-containing protein [Pseudonocardia sp. KRD291]MBW0101353.1 DUF5134 domain-containing protein [Pseudonocardia sp. KRD291]
MITSLPLALALSVVFAATGAYALVRWSAAMTGPLPPSRRMAELAHLLMSVAMVVMTWSWAGTTGVTVQIVAFSVFTGYFVLDAVRRYRTGSHGCAGGSAHALMAAAMVWMLAAMPLIMPTPVVAGAGGHGGHSGHGGGDGAAMDMGAHAGPAAWAVVVTIGACAALLATSVFWTVRGLRGRTVVAGAPLPEVTTTEAAAEPVPTGGGTAVATAAPAATATVAALATHRLLGPRSDAGCHALMGLGMIAMLLAMVAGW